MAVNRRLRTWVALPSLLGAFAVPQKACGVVDQGSHKSMDEAFPKPRVVREQVRFWKKVFGHFTSTQTVIHDADSPNILVDLIDFESFAKRQGQSRAIPRDDRDEIIDKYMKRYELGLKRFRRERKGALRHGAIEKRLYKVYRKNPAALQRLYRGRVNLRAQTGLADDFRKAAVKAKAYLPYMERVFARHDVPILLTRLPFVESMFNLKARSKVGASGIWQFMPATAKRFVKVGRMVDERNSPYKATEAAAKLLSLNYQKLKSWPLAVTAYNHGRYGMKRAVRRVGTRDFDTIVRRYAAPSFGFASRNFYAEFLAAAETYAELRRSGGIEGEFNLPPIGKITLDKEVSVSQLIRYTPLTRRELAKTNPCLKERTFTRYKYRYLPPFYEIMVPRSKLRAVQAALRDIDGQKYARR